MKLRAPLATRALAWLMVLVCPSFAAAEDSKTTEDASSQTILAGRVLDVQSGTYREATLIHIEEGQIVALESAVDRPVPEGALDLSCHTVTPGLIDTHTHLCDITHSSVDWWTLPSPTFGIFGAVNAEKTLRAGITTVRNVSEPFFCGTALREAIKAGWAEGPHMYASGPMITMTGGHGAPANWLAPQYEFVRPPGAVADGVDEVRQQVRTHIKHGVDWIKLAATGGFGTYGSLPGAASYSVEEMRAAVEEAAKVGRHVTAHAHGAEGVRNAIEAGVRSIEHGTLMDEATIQAFLEADVFLVTDLLAARYDLIETDQDWSDKDLEHSNAEEYRQYTQRVARAHRAGVRIAFGTDAGIYPHGRNAEQLGLLVNDVGMTPLEAIRSATLVAAELLGIEERVGEVAVGYRADLIAVDGDPLADVSTFEQVRFVMKEGRVIVPGPSCGSVGVEAEDAP